MLLLLPAFAAFSQNPTPHDWENELVIGINKESARAHSIPYASIQQASEDLRLNSPYLLDLNGTWRFNWVKHPDLRPMDFYLEDYEDSNTCHAQDSAGQCSYSTRFFAYLEENRFFRKKPEVFYIYIKTPVN